MSWLKILAEDVRALFSKMPARHSLFGGLISMLLLIFLIPTIIGLVVGLIWFIVKLPFNLLHLIFVTGIGGLLGVIWRVFSGFFRIFGIFGEIVMWLVVAAGVAFASIFLYHFFRPIIEKHTRRKSER